jgi:hypothetical protein
VITTATVTVTGRTSGKTATATASCSIPVPFGVNLAMLPQIAPSLGGIGHVKAFISGSPPDGVPTSWPGSSKTTPVPAGVRVMMCFTPDPVKLLSAGGPLDGAIADWIAGANPGDWVTAHMEGNLPGNAFRSVPGSSPAMWADMHGYLHALVAKRRPDIAYGVNYGMGAAAAGTQTLADWAVAGMGFLACDGYAHQAADSPASVFGTGWNQILSVLPDARPGIAETNTTADATGKWFTDCMTWLESMNGVLFSLWAGAGTHFTYSWPPSPQALAALQSVSAQCAA